MTKLNETQVKIMRYLVEKARNGEKIPSLSDLSKELNINYMTLSDNLIKLNKLNRISYKCGKVLNVYITNIKGNQELKKIEQHKTKYGVKELEEKFDKCVKDIICDYISHIDASAFTSDKINNTILGITTITNKLKSKLFD